MAKYFFLILALTVQAQTPRQVKQGQVLRIEDSSAAAARLAGRTIKIFPQGSGPSLGLMPVGAEQETGSFTLELLDAKGAVLKSEPVTILDAHYAKQNIVIAKEISELKPAAGEEDTVKAFRNLVTDERRWSEPLQLPIPGCMISPYGVGRLHNGKPTGNYHAGLDQRGAAGAPIHAVAAGTIRIAQMFNLRGGTVGIDHGQGVETIYMHMSKIAAVEGAQVNAGDVIGYIGATGRATGPHLHWSLYVNAIPVNPTQWVKLNPCSTTKSKARPRRRRSR